MSKFMSKYGHKTINWFERIVNKLGGEEGAECFLRGEYILSAPSCSWRDEKDVIYFSVKSDGTTAEDWVIRLKRKGFRVNNYTNSLLRSSHFKPTNGVTIEVAVLRGSIFSGKNRTILDFHAEANKRKLLKPNAELACLIREKFTDSQIEAMGLWSIIVMHEPIKTPDDWALLAANRNGHGRWLRGEHYDSPDCLWGLDYGFAFVVSETFLP